jgi:hypothetical protein
LFVHTDTAVNHYHSGQFSWRPLKVSHSTERMNMD